MRHVYAMSLPGRDSVLVVQRMPRVERSNTAGMWSTHSWRNGGPLCLRGARLHLQGGPLPSEQSLWSERCEG